MSHRDGPAVEGAGRKLVLTDFQAPASRCRLMARTRPTGTSALTSAFEGKSGLNIFGSSSSHFDPKRALDPISTHSFVGGEQDRWRDRQVERLRPALTLSDAALR